MGYNSSPSNTSRKITVPVYQTAKDFRASLLKTQSQLPRLFISPICDARYFDSPTIHFFQKQTLPELRLVFRSELWEDHTLLAVGQSSPAILHLMCAIGIYHRELLTRSSARCYSRCSDSNDDRAILLALDHHTKAAHLMQQAVGSISPDIDSIKLGCILFTILEFARGSRKTITSHLAHGMELFNLTRHSERLKTYSLATDTMLLSMSLLQCLYGRPRKAQFPTLYRLPTHTLSCLEREFKTLAQARAILVDIVASILDFVRRMVYSSKRPSEDSFKEQAALSSRLAQWSTLFQTLLIDLSDSDRIREADALQIHYSVATIFVASAVTQSETAFDQHVNVFRSVVDMAEKITNDISISQIKPRLFSFDLGLIPILFFTAIKCRHSVIRRKAIALLLRVPLREGAWNALEAALVAEQAINWEEGNIVDAQAGGFLDLPDTARIYDIDLDEYKDATPTTLKITFRYKPRPLLLGFEEIVVFVDLSADQDGKFEH
ncbi:hypothetical protein V502_02628 [Pseudogymnoascus sp. VKM F-4520 (FW-2644)]|nr:hypothetical protein V502_02628 [Pseudogymnoascus sp. VKM F-4520 (FW-2644)]